MHQDDIIAVASVIMGQWYKHHIVHNAAQK
nr:MAG TPA: Small archaeal modifier protein 2 like protein, PROTEIN BINDING [Caudoviricetes sp.]